VVETVDAHGFDCGEGRVVITDLHNYGMPFIRYVNGDVASRMPGTCRCGRQLPRLRSVDGRSCDALSSPDGGLVSQIFFPHIMKDVAGIARFQVVQKAPDVLVVRLVRAPGFDQASLDFLRHEIGKVFGPRMQVRFEFPAEIPLTSSGKLRVTVNETAAR
jgi:phenylacetate-CoA ligase